MPVTHIIESDPPLVAIKAVGEVALEEIVQLYEAFFSDPAYTPGMSRLFDARGTTISLTTEDVWSLVDFYKNRRKDRVYCAVVVGDEVTRRSAKLYATTIIRANIHAKVFEDVNEARAWLAEITDQQPGKA